MARRLRLGDAGIERLTQTFHALDVPLVLETIDVGGYTGRSKAARDLSRRLAATWTAFARSRKPDNPAIRHWPAYTAADQATLILDRECRVENDTAAKRGCGDRPAFEDPA
jgi:para-nitrobenzyl esterase